MYDRTFKERNCGPYSSLKKKYSTFQSSLPTKSFFRNSSVGTCMQNPENNSILSSVYFSLPQEFQEKNKNFRVK